MEEKLNEFRCKLVYESKQNDPMYEGDIINIYKDIISHLSLDYDDYIKYSPPFLDSLESNSKTSLALSIHIFFELYEKLIEKKIFSYFDQSISNHDFDETIVDVFEELLATAASNNIQRLSGEYYDISSLSENKKKELASLLITKIQAVAKSPTWDSISINNELSDLVLLRQLLKSIGNLDLFYYVSCILIDRVNSSEYFQVGRDISEEFILTSFKDNCPELGYYIAFRSYSFGSIHASLFYANLSLSCIINKSGSYSEKFVKEILGQGVKLFRNFNMSHYVEQLYNNIPLSLSFTGYERRSLDHSYFTALLKNAKENLPNDLLDYLLKEKENIFKGGEHDAFPWLNTLYNLKRIYPKADFSSTGLGFFITVFESIVPHEKRDKLKAIVDADHDKLVKYLKESLAKLDSTRNLDDFVYDNSMALTISNRLISDINIKPSSFLLAMTIKSDYNLLFKSKESKELAPLDIPILDIESMNSIYEDGESFVEKLSIYRDSTIIWLALSEGELFQLKLDNGNFSNLKSNYWSNVEFNNLNKEKYFFNIIFSDTGKDGEIYMITPEEYKEQEDNIIKQLDFAKISVQDNAKSLLVVKDMDLANYPHNLSINENKQLISKKIPVTNVLSTEWLLNSSSSNYISSNYTKSIWIPTETGDIALNYLYCNIEDSLRRHCFNIETSSKIDTPLSSEINIFCSHGADNISETQIVFQNDVATYNIDSLIGKGKILIFFVCYSGSMNRAFLKNSVTSLVQKFIAQGYDAVIAPFWALDVRIPKYWLPEFLDSINRGDSIAEAVFRSNKKVCEIFPTPAAWACLHLYGNPNLKIRIS